MVPVAPFHVFLLVLFIFLFGSSQAQTDDIPSESPSGFLWTLWRRAGSNGQVTPRAYHFLRSPNGEYDAALVLNPTFCFLGVLQTEDNSTVSSTPAFPVGGDANVTLVFDDELRLEVNGRVRWIANISGLGGDVIKMLNSGSLAIISTKNDNATVWLTAPPSSTTPPPARPRSAIPPLVGTFGPPAPN